MLTTGNQLRAGRAFAGLTLQELAKASGVNSQTIHRMEQQGGARLTSGLDTVLKIAAALEKKGIVFVEIDGKPGVRLR